MSRSRALSDTCHPFELVQLLANLQKDVPLCLDQLLAFGLVMIIIPEAATGVFVKDRVCVPTGVYQSAREVDKEDLLSLHDEVAQVELRIMHHTCRVDLAQCQHGQTTVTPSQMDNIRRTGNSGRSANTVTHQNSS